MEFCVGSSFCGRVLRYFLVFRLIVAEEGIASFLTVAQLAVFFNSDYL